jgi:hypothetical protein
MGRVRGEMVSGTILLSGKHAAEPRAHWKWFLTSFPLEDVGRAVPASIFGYFAPQSCLSCGQEQQCRYASRIGLELQLRLTRDRRDFRLRGAIQRTMALLCCP